MLRGLAQALEISQIFMTFGSPKTIGAQTYFHFQKAITLEKKSCAPRKWKQR